MSKFYDKNTLYLESGVANESQVLNAIMEGIKKCEVKLKRSLKCKMNLNLIKSRDGIYFGIGYLWVDNCDVYWILSGRNIDGTERVEEYEDPEWKPSGKDMSASFGGDWAEIASKMDESKPKIIRKQLPSLIEFPFIKYTEKQKAFLKKEGKEVSDGINLVMGRAYINKPPPTKMSSVLCCRYVPKWIPTKVFKNIFLKYVSDSNTVIEMKTNGKTVRDNAPLITRSKNIKVNKRNKTEYDVIFVTYDPNTNDASFARLIQRKTRIKHPKRSDLKCELIFDYAFKNDNSEIKAYRSRLHDTYKSDFIGKKCIFCGYTYTIKEYNKNTNEITIIDELNGKTLNTELSEVELF